MRVHILQFLLPVRLPQLKSGFQPRILKAVDSCDKPWNLVSIFFTFLNQASILVLESRIVRVARPSVSFVKGKASYMVFPIRLTD
jgi:hypothetical protein